ncbi:MAG: hypothetical protein H8E20_09060 [Verrucomicrobia bacterium]|nr:hypothetical protein [Verrucomicrobiota bacterium]
MEKVLRVGTVEESSSELITFYEDAEPGIKKLAKTASQALDQGDFVFHHFYCYVRAQRIAR